MAATSEGAALTEQQRLQQQKLRAEFLVAFLQLWPLLDTDRLDDTGPGWVSAVMTLIRRFRLQSARIASRYYIEYRAAEVPAVARRELVLPPGVERPTPREERGSSSRPSSRRSSSAGSSTPSPATRADGNASRRGDTPTPSSSRESRSGGSDTSRAASGGSPSRQGTRTGDRRVRLDLDESAFQPRDDGRRTRIEIPDIDWGPSDRAARVSLTVTGPVAQKKSATQGKNAEQARKDSLVQASGAASRHVLTGGRRSLLTLLDDDPQALGWIRVTDGDPCAFCAMLSSRGIVFRSEQSASFLAHDHCQCTAEPAYSRSAPWPGRAKEFRKLWDDHIKGNYSGKEAIKAFRRLYEQQQRAQRDTGAA